MILTGPAIKRGVEQGLINIDPFNPDQLNPNSYNVRLDQCMFFQPAHVIIDPKQPTHVIPLRMDPVEQCFVLHPGRLYLGNTIEYVGSDYYAPMLNGRSSLGRLGLSVHITAGFGDIGFHGRWTLEFTTVNTIRLYPRMEIAQIAFFKPCDEGSDERRLYDGKYQNSSAAVPSMIHQEMERVYTA